jgi:hypothetical protein
MSSRWFKSRGAMDGFANRAFLVALSIPPAEQGPGSQRPDQ